MRVAGSRPKKTATEGAAPTSAVNGTTEVVPPSAGPSSTGGVA